MYNFVYTCILLYNFCLNRQNCVVDFRLRDGLDSGLSTCAYIAILSGLLWGALIADRTRRPSSTVEQRYRKPQVEGSNPLVGSMKFMSMDSNASARHERARAKNPAPPVLSEVRLSINHRSMAQLASAHAWGA